ncbi:MAG: PAS domain S-box protein [Verrucomicrobia bacterium]|nr:PAS domain S-box protein [Verrucomicrobiota bacterium]
MPPSLNLLLVEDSPADAEMVLRQLRRAGLDFTCRQIDNEADFLAAIATNPDLVLSDYQLPQFSAPRALELLQQSGLDLPFIVISGTIGEDTAVQIMRQGADDYLIKDRLARLGQAITHALDAARLRREQRALSESLQEVQARYRAIFENSIEGIYRSDPDGGFLLVNPALVRILGYASPEELIESRGSGMRHGYVEPGRRAEFQRRLREEGMVVNFESEVVRRDGTRIWVTENARVVRDAEGNVLCHEGTLEDITERKHAEEQVRLLSHALREAPISVVITNPAGEIEYVNPRFTEVTGYTFEEVCGRNPRILKSNQMPPEVYADLWATISAGREWRGELLNRRKDQMPYWESATISPLCNDQGQITHYIAIKEDITERRQAAADLKLFRTLIERSSDAILVVDPATGQIWDTNETACLALGYPRGELQNLSVFDIDPEMDLELFSAIGTRLRRTGSLTVERQNRRKDGSTYPVEISLSLVTLDRDFVVGIVRDITERREAERRIREQAELLNHATDAIYVRRLDGALTYWNDSAERLFGWTRAEVIERKITELNLQDLDLASEAGRDFLGSGQWSGELRLATKSGRVVSVLSRLNLVRDSAGRPVSVFSINTDITEKKQIEARFLQAQRLENLGALASGLAHDLNNVLAPILMGASILQGRTGHESDRKLIATIEASAQRGTDIVRQVLTFARGVEGERVPVQMRHLLREMADIATATFPPTIAITLHAPKELWPVLGDATQLHQILMNLAINARDAMPHGGALTLSAENLEIDAAFAAMTPDAKPGRHVSLRVVDTGCGIPPDIRERIFEPFFTTKAPGKGTGLGLSTVLGIARSHGGFVRCQSEPGVGSSFEVCLPAALGEKAVPDDAAPPCTPRGAGQEVLLVDDEPAIRSVGTRILEQYGYRPVVAADGTEALAVYVQRQGEIAAIITDLTMPGMDGPTLIRTLRRISPRLPILAMTGHSERISGDSEVATASTALLIKPFTADALLSLLHRVLQAQPGTRIGGSAHPWPLLPPATHTGEPPRTAAVDPEGAPAPLAHPPPSLPPRP